MYNVSNVLMVNLLLKSLMKSSTTYNQTVFLKFIFDLLNIRSPGQINTTILSIFWISTFCGLSMTTTPPEFPHRRIDPLDPRSYPQGGSKFTQSQIYYTKLTLWPCIRFHLDFNPRWFLTYNLTYLRSSSFRLDLGPKNGPKLGQKCQKFKIFKKVKNVKCLVFQLII